MGQLTNTWTGPVVGTHVPDPSGMNKNDSTEPRMGTGAQLKNDWAGPQEGTHVPDPSGMDANTWKGPVVGTGPTNERDGSGMIAQDVSTTYKTDSQGNPTTELMTRGEEQLHEALAAGGSFDKQMAGMDNVTTVGGWATDMAQDGLFADPDTKSPKWPKAGEQVPDPSGMDTVDDHFPATANLGRIIEADKDKTGEKWPPIGETTIGKYTGSLVPDPAGMDTWDDNPIDPHEHDIHRQKVSEAAMPRQPDDLNASFVSQERLQGLLGNIPGMGPAPRFVQPASGEVDLHRRAVEIANGFQMPVQYSMKFKCPSGISQPRIVVKTKNEEVMNPHSERKYIAQSFNRTRRTTEWKQPTGEKHGYVEQGGLDWQSHIMNNSIKGYSGTEGSIQGLYRNAAQVSQTIWDPLRGKGKKEEKMEDILNLFCSKVSMPEKSINFQSMRHYGTHFAYPQSVSYGTMSTTFYCDASMHIKKYFDAWQKLIFNDITGNFNYYEEFTSEFDIFTRSVVGAGESAAEQDKNWFEKGQDSFREIMDTVNQYTGLQGRSGGPHRTYSDYKYPKMEFRNTYGVKVMECWPQIVGSVDLGHASTNSIAEFTVTWAYKKWNTFNLGEIGKRGQVNLSNSVLHEKGDGIPFIQDMPQELRGPLTQQADQAILTSPMQRGFSVTG